eukprot:g44450.t1
MTTLHRPSIHSQTVRESPKSLRYRGLRETARCSRRACRSPPADFMIHSILIVNNHGQARLARFYTPVPVNKRMDVIRDIFTQVSKRAETVCNFLESTGLEFWGEDVRLIYRHYATLYFVFAVSTAESELGILDLIQVFVESLDKCFENVCELDLIFHSDKVHFIIDEIVMAGMVLETSLKEILKAVNGSVAHERVSKSKASSSKKNPKKIGL